MRRRLLLLGVGIASLGAIFASAVLANPTSSSPTSGSTTVSVQGITGLSVALASTDSILPANGSAHKIADVKAGENDADYNIAATAVNVTNQGKVSVAADCSGITIDNVTDRNITSAQYTISATSNLNDHTLLADSATADTDVGDLSLTLPVTVANACTVSGGVVTVTFQAQ